MHIEVKSLSPALRDALAAVRYGAADIRVEPAESVDAYSEGGKGSRGFTMLVNLDTGERKSMLGAWGGAAIAATPSMVDHGSDRVPLPENGACIKGTVGGRTWATIYMPPAAMRLLGSGDDEMLTGSEQQAIYCFAAIKGGQYRRDEMRRRGVTDATVDSLVERGYLKRSRNGATQITTKGKNARTVRY